MHGKSPPPRKRQNARALADQNARHNANARRALRIIATIKKGGNTRPRVQMPWIKCTPLRIIKMHGDGDRQKSKMHALADHQSKPPLRIFIMHGNGVFHNARQWRFSLCTPLCPLANARRAAMPWIIIMHAPCKIASPRRPQCKCTAMAIIKASRLAKSQCAQRKNNVENPRAHALFVLP